MAVLEKTVDRVATDHLSLLLQSAFRCLIRQQQKFFVDTIFAYAAEIPGRKLKCSSVACHSLPKKLLFKAVNLDIFALLFT